MDKILTDYGKAHESRTKQKELHATRLHDGALHLRHTVLFVEDIGYGGQHYTRNGGGQMLEHTKDQKAHRIDGHKTGSHDGTNDDVVQIVIDLCGNRRQEQQHGIFEGFAEQGSIPSAEGNADRSMQSPANVDILGHNEQNGQCQIHHREDQRTFKGVEERVDEHDAQDNASQLEPVAQRKAVVSRNDAVLHVLYNMQNQVARHDQKQLLRQAHLLIAESLGVHMGDQKIDDRANRNHQGHQKRALAQSHGNELVDLLFVLLGAVFGYVPHDHTAESEIQHHQGGRQRGYGFIHAEFHVTNRGNDVRRNDKSVD